MLGRGGQRSFKATAVWMGFSLGLSYLNAVPDNKAVYFKSSSDYVIVELRDIFVTRSHLSKGLIVVRFRKRFLFTRIPLLKQLMKSETFPPTSCIGDQGHTFVVFSPSSLVSGGAKFASLSQFQNHRRFL